MTAVVDNIVRKLRSLQLDGLVFPMTLGVDFFARTGEWVTSSFEPIAKSWICCEINEAHKNALANTMPFAKLVFGDSFRTLTELENIDVALADCPQGLFGENREYCEHFEFLPLLMERLSDRAVLFLNVNIEPYHDPAHSANRPDNYGMSSFSQWAERRNEFYGHILDQQLSLDFVQTFYEAFFKDCGYNLREFISELEPSNLPGHGPHILRVATLLER